MVFFEEDQLIFRNSPPHQTVLDKASPASASPVNILSDLEILRSKNHIADPALAVLLLTVSDCDGSLSPSSSAATSISRMDTAPSAADAIGETGAPAFDVVASVNSNIATHSSLEQPLRPDATALEAKAAAAIAESESRASEFGVKPHRIDSGHEETRPRTSHSVSGSPPITQGDSARSRSDTTPTADVHQQSPVVYKPATPGSRTPITSQNTLRRATSSAGEDGTPTSPLTERLPSFRQFTGQLGQLGQLSDLAEAAASQEATQAFSHSHKPSFGSATSQSPRLPYHHSYSTSAQTSPISHYAYTARSPTSTIGESQHYGSPPRYAPSAYYADRRSGALPESAIVFPPSIPSMPSASSSGESQGHAGSTNGDGYSTTHTTPIEQSQMATPRPILPPPPGMPSSAVLPNAVFKCDYPGCTAAPFHTQYLLR
nr:hypothetical protein CFP56_09124 [Quercus suber]